MTPPHFMPKEVVVDSFKEEQGITLVVSRVLPTTYLPNLKLMFFNKRMFERLSSEAFEYTVNSFVAYKKPRTFGAIYDVILILALMFCSPFFFIDSIIVSENYKLLEADNKALQVSKSKYGTQIANRIKSELMEYHRYNEQF
jgi:hypothetical protein